MATQSHVEGGESAARVLLVAWVHLGVLWTFAFAKPLFDVLADSPDFFVARGNTSFDIVVMALALTVVAPGLLVVLEALFWRWPPVRRAIHLVFVAGLAGAFALQVLDDAIGGSSALLLVLAALAGIGVAVAYRSTRVVSAVLTVLGPAPLIFLAIFLLLSPVADLVLPQEEATEASSASSADTPVVLLVLDELDSNMLMAARERIDRTRYPDFATLASKATWYRNATTAAGLTTVAVPGLLSGRRPPPGALAIASDFPNNLFTLLRESHSMHVIETATTVCSEKVCGERAREPVNDRLGSLTSDLGVVSLHLLLPQGLRSELPPVDRTFADFRGGGRDEASAGGQAAPPAQGAEFYTSRTGAFDAFLRDIRPPEGRPGLHFLHAAFPHVPWQYLPSGEQYLVNGPETPGLSEEQWVDQPFPPRLGMQRHLLQLGYADRLIGRLVARLKATGVFDEAMIVVTADHGVSFRPGLPRRTITRPAAADIAAVPLIVKYPGQARGRIDDSMVRSIDVVPTIAKELGLPIPSWAEGRAADEAPDRGRVTVAVDHDDSAVSLSFADFVRERRLGLRRMTAMFGAADGGAGLYATGPDRDLLGLRAPRLPAAPAEQAEVDLDSTELLDRFRPAGQLAPSFVTGRILGELPEGIRLAVAVNGTVRGVTVSFREGEELRLAAVVPAASFRVGYNVVDAYAIRGTGSRRRLAPLRTERPAAYRLVERDGETLIMGAGREVRVEEGQVEGFVDELIAENNSVRLGGWAIERKAKRPADALLVFDGGRFLAAGRPTLVRPDIAKDVGSLAVAKSGFRLQVSIGGVDLDRVRVYAVGGDVASVLPRYKLD